MKELNIFLKKSILFENISDDELTNIIEQSHSKIITIKKNEYLFYQGEIPKYLYLLIDGTVQIEKVDTNGKRMIMNRFDEIGTMFAEVYIYFDSKLYDYSCLSIKNSKIFAIPKDFFLNLTVSNSYHHKITQNMLRILSRKAFYLNQKVLILSSFTLRQKIASYLLQRLDKSENFGKLLFKREELADFIGTTRPSLSREMLLMQDEGIIILEKDSFKVLDMKKLKDII